MSVGNNLQEMENVVTKGAAAAEPMPTAGIPVEDLGGPTPDNSRPDDDSNKLKEPAGTLKQVKDVVNAKAAPAEEAEVEPTEDQEVVSEAEDAVSEEDSEEIVAEAEETEEELVEEEGIDIEADVQALLEGEELSEEFEEKARTIFEAAITSKVETIKEQLIESYQEALVEEVVAIKEELNERVDSYLEYVADEWFSENALAVESGLKSEVTESFLDGMKSLFEEHYVSIPEEKYDVLDEMTNKLDEMEEKLNEQIDKNVSLNGTINARTRESLIAEVSKGLAQTQAEKLASLAESVEFESEESFKEKLATLKENYFPKEKVSAPKEDVATGEVAAPAEGAMAAYVNAISQWQ